MSIVFFFVFFYPLMMSALWVVGSLVFYFKHEARSGDPTRLPAYPRVAILVPCHNEALVIRDTIERLAENRYPNFEIIAVDDGSTDMTAAILEELAMEVSGLRVVHLKANYGKAMALNAGALASDAEYLMCIDADALLDRNALFWMMRHFLDGPRVGAVTGNPRVINRGSLLSRIQIGEYSAIVGMVKRAQRGFGRLFTVSGVNACFRRSAVHSVGYWSPATVTEDIDISWRLQLHHWDIRYEPRALTWILVPQTFRSLWRQRLRWARGGAEAALKYAPALFHWRKRRMWWVYAEYVFSVTWCFAFALTVLFFLATVTLPGSLWPQPLAVPTLLPGWAGVLLGLMCLVQFAVSLALDSLYERQGLLRYLYWAIWYPAVYWLLSAATTVVAVPKALSGRRRLRYGIWRSPERAADGRILQVMRKKRPERRMFYNVQRMASSVLETVVTLIFWGAWVYLVTPLLSLVLWLAGVYLFIDRMVLMGGYQSFVADLEKLGLPIVVMVGGYFLWVGWNWWRFNRIDRRVTAAPPVTTEQIAYAFGISPAVVGQVRRARRLSVFFTERNRPIVDRLMVGDVPAAQIPAAATPPDSVHR